MLVYRWLTSVFALSLAFALGVSVADSTASWAAEPETEALRGLPFIAPNEFDSRLYEPWVRNQTGALISVGSFRTLTTAGLGSFSHVVLFDYDPRVQGFNRFNLELVGRSASRLEYLNSLFELELTPEELRIAQSSFAEEQRLLRAKLEPKLAAKTLLSWSNTYAAPYAESVSKDMRKIILSEYLGQETSERWLNSIFGSDLIFKRVQRLVHSGSVEIVQGSLVGAREMLELGARLRQKGIHVSVVDVSNAPRKFRSDTSGDISPLRHFVANLKTLPNNGSTLVLETGNSWLPRRAHADQWNYYVIPWEEYLASMPGRLFLPPQQFELNRLKAYEVTQGERARELRCALGYSAVMKASDSQ